VKIIAAGLRGEQHGWSRAGAVFGRIVYREDFEFLASSMEDKVPNAEAVNSLLSVPSMRQSVRWDATQPDPTEKARPRAHLTCGRGGGKKAVAVVSPVWFLG